MSCRRLLLAARAGIATAFLLSPPLAAQLDARLLRGPYLQSPSSSAVVLRWRTDRPTESRVRFGEEALDRERTVPGLRTEHRVRLEELEPARRYRYAVGSAAGDLATGTFRTAPPKGTRAPVRIWTFGDSGDPRFAAAQAAVRDAHLARTGERGTDVWIVLGDNAYFAGTDADYQLNFFGPYAGVLRDVPVWSALGNHDGLTASSADGTGPYYDIFDLPTAGESGGEPSGTEAWYSFDHGNVHFVALDSYESARVPGSPMLEWLERDLAANDQEWTIAFFHHPVYSGGTHPTDTDTGTSPTSPDPADDFAIQEMREHVLPILEAGGVDVVLTAHSHNYERSFLIDGHYGTSDTLGEEMVLDPGDGAIGGDGPYRKTGELFGDAHSGTIVAVVGTGAEASEPDPHPAIVASAGVPGSLVLDVDGPRLDGAFVAGDGRVLDRFTLLRGDLDLAPVAHDDAAATAPGTPIRIPVLANDFDPDGDLLMIESVTRPAHGEVDAPVDGTITYRPAPDYTGGSDEFRYTVADGRGLTASATVRITVACPPAADGAWTDDLEPGPAAGWRVETAANDLPASATWSVVEDGSASSPSHSWFSAADAATSTKDDRLISPPLDLTVESLLTFRHRYRTEEGFDGGVLEISLDGGATWTDLGGSILAGGYDASTIAVDGARRPAWTGARDATMEEVRVDLGAFAGAGRQFRWRLLADLFTAEATIGWHVDDVAWTGLASGPGACNLPPLAADDAATTTVDRAVAIEVLANDVDPEGRPLSLAAIGAPAHGTTAAAPDGRIVYEPASGFSGEDRFTYEVSDGAARAGAAVLVRVVPSGDEPGRARAQGEVDGGDGAIRFAFHGRRSGTVASGWLRFGELEGSVGDLRFPAAGRVELAGSGWLADGTPVRFRASAVEPAADRPARFSIEVAEAGGDVIERVEGPLLRGEVRID